VVRVLTKDMIVGVTVSIGVAVLGSHGGDLDELLEAADVALYRAKRAGRDRVCLANPADRRSPRRRSQRVRHKRIGGCCTRASCCDASWSRSAAR
jgi:predicted signal transduction protein with EAL and GGDEF domain